jgi:hypothetical protein
VDGWFLPVAVALLPLVEAEPAVVGGLLLVLPYLLDDAEVDAADRTAETYCVWSDLSVKMARSDASLTPVHARKRSKSTT